MNTYTKIIKIETNKDIQLFDITQKVESIVEKSGVKDGLVTVFTKHTTCAVNINEYEENLMNDLENFLKDFAPKAAGYGHDKVAYDGRPNAHSHIIGMFMNTSESIPIVDGKMVLGTWQSIFFIEIDGPRPSREVLVHIS